MNKNQTNDSSSALIRQATCAVLINGQVKGTAWLVASAGYLLTAGHILGVDAPVANVEVLFVEDVPLLAHKVQWEYQPLSGTDFAILKLEQPPFHLRPLPIALTKAVSGAFKLCGFGVTLVDRSEGIGSFAGSLDPQNFSGNQLFILQSSQVGEPGYSGAAIYSEVLQAVVAIQIEASKVTVGTGHDTVLAMPLYRIAQRWDLLHQLDNIKARNSEMLPVGHMRNNWIFDTTAVRSSHFVGRTQEMEELERHVFALDSQTVVITAIHGMGGIGKTALVTEFVHLHSEKFPGGIIWADFPSHQGDPLPILASWAQLCGRSDLKDLPSKDIRAQSVKRAMKEHIDKNGAMLAIFDDVRNTTTDAWLDGVHLLRKAIPDGVPLIITTRQTSIVESLRGHHLLTLDSLKTEKAVELIRILLPTIQPKIASELAQLTGNLPFAIEITASKIKSTKGDWLLESLRDLETRLDVLNIASTKRKEDSIRLSFDLSFDDLSADTAELFQILSVFIPGYIEQEWISGVIGYNKRISFQGSYPLAIHLEALVERSLLQRTKSGYRLHPLLHDYALLKLKNHGMYEEVILSHMDYFLDLLTLAELPWAVIDVALENIKQAFDHAYNKQYWNEVIQNVQHFAFVGKFLHSRGYWQRAIEYLSMGLRACEQLGAHTQRAKFLCQLGIYQRESGYYDDASVTFRKAVLQAEEIKDDKMLADVYFNTGYLQLYQSKFDIATVSFRKAIDFAEYIRDNNALGESLRGLGRIALSQGSLELAEQNLQRSRKLLTSVNNLQGLAYSLRGLGEVYTLRRMYSQALEYLNDALKVAINIEDKQAIAYIYRGLGDIYRWQGNNQSALDAYIRSERLYIDVGDRAALSASLCSIGETYLLLALTDKASSYFTESYSLAESVQVTRWQGRSLWGLAQAEKQAGNIPEALRLGRQALTILKKARHRDMDLIQHWLDTLN